MLSYLKKHTYIFYTVLFIASAAVIYSPYIAGGYSFVWHDGLWNDGYNQHYTVLVYLGRFYRSLLCGFLHGDFTVPQFDFSLGVGEGIIPALNYYGLGDVFTLFSALVPASATHILYCALVILRLYLAGISFIYFCRYHKSGSVSAAAGALVYVFCGYALFEAVRHPFFLNPMIYLPAAAVGCSRIMHEKRAVSLCFVLSFILLAMSGFYFTYMLTAFAFVYVIIVHLASEDRKNIRLLLIRLVKTGLNYMLALSCAAVIFVPAVLAFLSSSRSSGAPLDISSLFLWRTSDIYAYTAGLFVPFISDTSPGLSAAVIPALIILFRTRANRALKAGIILTALMFFIPLGGYIMNGFSYPANRWSFIFSFLLAYAVTAALPLFKSRRAPQIMLIFIFANVCINGLLIYGVQGYTKEAKKLNSVYSADTAAENSYSTNSDFSRQSLAYKYHENMPVLYDKPGISEYFSIVNRNYTEFLDRLEISPAFISDFKLNGVDNRLVPESLLCVKNSRYKNELGENREYENSSRLPFGYTYTDYITEEQADGLDGLQLQSLMTTCAVLGSEPDTSLNRHGTQTGDVYELPFEYNNEEISFTVPAAGEVYVRLKITDIGSNTEVTLTSDGIKKELFILKKSHRYYLGKSDFTVCMGSMTPGQHTVSVTKNSGCSLKIRAVTMYDTAETPSELAALAAEPLENLKTDKNTVSGTVSTEQNKILVMSLPYSSGWSAELDGRKADIIRANYGFSALCITPGDHTVTLRYSTPGIKAGAALSALGLLILLIILALRILRKIKMRKI